MVWNDICAIKVHSKIIFCWLVVISDKVYSENKSEKVFAKYNLINSVLFFEMFKFSFFDYKLVQIKKQIINQSVSVSSEH